MKNQKIRSMKVHEQSGYNYKAKISFQAKYFEGNVSFSKIKESMNQAIKHYKNELDLIYLFCNKTLTTTNKGYKDTVELLKKAGIELYPISNKEVLDLVYEMKKHWSE